MMSTNFRPGMFGGFDRTDVIKDIEQSAREAQEKTEALEKENNALRMEKERMEQALRTLHAQRKRERQDEVEQVSLQQQLEMVRAELNTVKEEAETLRREKETLRTENEGLRAAASEYINLKEHIGDIEISAHRRTEEFRAQAIERLRQIIGQQRGWCQAQRGQYAFINEKLLQEVRRTEDILVNCDFSGFDTMLEGLQNLEDSLK